MNSVDETARDMNVLSGLKDKFMQGLNIYQSITMMKYYKNMGRGAQETSRTAKEADIQDAFTGQHTDIALIDANDGKIALDDIGKIDDETLRQNTYDSFANAARDGYVEFDPTENAYRLTNRGNEHINSEAFIEQFKKDRLNQVESQKLAQVKLNGNKNDLNVFRYTDSFNINRLMANPQDLKRVVAYMQLCESYDFVNISSDGTVTPTDKCKLYLSQNPDCSIEVTKITTDNAESLANRGAIAANKGTYERGVKTTAREAGGSAVKTGAKEGGKKAAKAGAQTAAKAGGAAASAGASAAADVVVQLTKKGAKILEPDTKATAVKAARFQ